MLGAEARHVLLRAAEDAIVASLLAGRSQLPELDGAPPELTRDGASFVTLTRNDRLLGCIGTIDPVQPLLLDVAANAVNAAFRDPRLPPIRLDDYREMDLKVSVLTPLEALDARDPAELGDLLTPGLDGLLVESGPRRGTFLPSVWAQLPRTDDFLAHLWQKAGLRAGSWPDDLRMWRYRTVEFGTSGPRPVPVAAGGS